MKQFLLHSIALLSISILLAGCPMVTSEPLKVPGEADSVMMRLEGNWIAKGRKGKRGEVSISRIGPNEYAALISQDIFLNGAGKGQTYICRTTRFEGASFLMVQSKDSAELPLNQIADSAQQVTWRMHFLYHLLPLGDTAILLQELRAQSAKGHSDIIATTSELQDSVRKWMRRKDWLLPGVRWKRSRE